MAATNRAGSTIAALDGQAKRRLLTALRANQTAALAGAAGSTGRIGHEAPRRVTRQGRCSSGKTCFPSERAARARLGEILDMPPSGRGYHPVNVHPCRKCGSWHLTAKGMKPWKHGKRR